MLCPIIFNSITNELFLFNKHEQDRTLANRWYEMTWINEFLWKKYQSYIFYD